MGKRPEPKVGKRLEPKVEKRLELKVEKRLEPKQERWLAKLWLELKRELTLPVKMIRGRRIERWKRVDVLSQEDLWGKVGSLRFC